MEINGNPKESEGRKNKVRIMCTIFVYFGILIALEVFIR